MVAVTITFEKRSRSFDRLLYGPPLSLYQPLGWLAEKLGEDGRVRFFPVRPDRS